MINEIIDNIIGVHDKKILDCTVGEGGHAEIILTRFPGTFIYGLDRNKEILEIARNRLSIFGERFVGVNKNFKDVKSDDLGDKNIPLDCALIDLGISTYHYKKSDLGFSFSKSEKLDMKLDNESKDVFDIINTYSEMELTEIFRNFGEERFSKKIAYNIINRRKKAQIKKSDELAEVIANAIPKKFHPKRINPATRCFQALRIYANDEFENIKKGIPNILSLLKTGGKLGVITFHSLEDRIVKRIFNELNKDCICPPESPICFCDKKKEIEWVAKMIKPSDEEINENPPSRSAKLRVVRKVA